MEIETSYSVPSAMVECGKIDKAIIKLNRKVVKDVVNDTSVYTDTITGSIKLVGDKYHVMVKHGKIYVLDVDDIKDIRVLR